MSGLQWNRLKALFTPSPKAPERPAASISFSHPSEPRNDIHQDGGSIGYSDYDPKTSVAPSSAPTNVTKQENPSEVVNHILVNLLEETHYPGPIYQAFNALGFTKPSDFAIVNLEELQELYPELSPAIWRKRLHLQEYYFHLLEVYGSNSLDDQQWLHITYQDITEYQVYCAKERHKASIAPVTTPSPINNYQATPITTRNEPERPKTIREMVKKDPNAYPEFKEERYYEQWITSVKAFANLHGTMKVLDATYVPNGIWEEEEFNDQQAFMWSVVVNKVLSTNGKMYIRQHPGNAKQIFKMLQ